MVLAAGHGRRLRPLTATLPKPAIPVLGRPMITQILRRLARAGCDLAVVNLHHRPDVMRRTIEATADGGLPELVFSNERQIRGTGGGVRRAARWLRGDGPILVVNGDILCDVDFAAVLEAHRGGSHAATVVLAPSRDGYSVVETDADGNVVSLAGRPHADPRSVAGRWLFTGCSVLDEGLLDRLPPHRPSDLVVDLFRDLAARGELGSFVHEGFWWEFGSPRLYLDGSLRLIDDDPPGALAAVEHDPLDRRGDALCVVGPGAEIDPLARLRGRVAVGFAARVGDDAEVEDSIVMPEAWLGPGARIRRSIVGPGVEVPAGFEGSDVVICQLETATADRDADGADGADAHLVVTTLDGEA